MKYVIVGGTSGIGLAATRMAVDGGHDVVAVGRDPTKFPAARSVGATPAQMDASSLAECQRFFAAQGAFDHLVLCASASAGVGSFRDLNLGELRKGFEGKFWAQVNCAKAALVSLRADGSITFVGAISSRAMKPGTAGLAAINAALEAMVPILASELRPTRVNAVAPGVVDTPWWLHVPQAARRQLFEQLASEVAVGRVGNADDLASAIMFLTTNTFVTGTILDCDGGWKLKNI